MLAGMLAGCAPHRLPPGDLSADEEKLLGDRLAAAVLATEDVVTDADVAAALGELARGCGAGEVSWHLVRLEQPVLLDLPGGHVILSTGLISAARDDAHLAALLAHGAAHAGRRHATLRLLRTHGSAKLNAMARGESDAAFSALAANAAAGGVLLRHGLATEKEADDVVVAAGCEAGAVATAVSGAAERGLSSQRLVAEHPQESPWPRSAAGATDEIERLRRRLGLP
jgi:predicted Zn-dependent protease